MHNPIITLTTDFGYRDPFVGIMKGVILDINPAATIVDITHDIGPQNIMEAAIAIEMSFKFFPHESIHVVIVDPGVGSVRRPILVTTDYYYFVGSDNGVFSLIYNLSESLNVIHITAEHYFLPQRSSTFHGRDIFAPVAAWFSRGIDISKFGDPITDYVTMPVPAPVLVEKNILEGEVIYIDRFGNAITNIKTKNIDELCSTPEGKPRALVKGIEVPLKNHYSEAGDEGLYSLINSFGYLELFVYRGSASSNFGIAVGEKVVVTLG
ncbi:MAG: SAM-dependent chlorinase/fluorinase [Thermodesulfovibrionales bacterium]|nr:SAM-dependent chlorinase/fluorinase [Thermodesulfovibrionales bacterium]